MPSFEKFLKDSIKVNGKKGQLGDEISVGRNQNKVIVSSQIQFSSVILSI